MKRVITLCGSVRFEEWFRIVNAELTLHGWVVLAPGFFNHELLHGTGKRFDDAKQQLDRLHYRKIEMSQAIFVIDVYGHIGESTGREIDFARSEKKKVYFWTRGDLWNLQLTGRFA